MKNKTLKLISLLLISCALNASSAHAWTLLGGVQQYGYTASGASSNPSFSPLGGLGFDFLMIEADALFTVKTYAPSTSSNSIQIPVFYRFPMMSPLQVGLGGFMDYSLTDRIGIPSTDYGLAGSIKFQLTRLSFDVRYLWGIADISGATSRALQFMVGCTF
jgi:hypothetical protein